LRERPGLFASRPHEAIIGQRLHHALGDVGVLELDTLCDQPVEVGEGVVGIQVHLCLVRIRAAGHQEILVEVLGTVLEACGALLQRAAAAADVQLATRERRRAATARADFKEHDFRAGVHGFDGRTGARGAETDDGDIGFEVEALHARERAGTGGRVRGGCRHGWLQS
jgi:hypothetical protein